MRTANCWFLPFFLVACKGKAADQQGTPAATASVTAAAQPSTIVAVASATASAAEPKPPCPDTAALIPGGLLKHASPDNPVKLVESTVSAFCIDKLEVTTASYEACVTEGKCTAGDSGGFCNGNSSSRSSDPINCVNWPQAEAYCKSKGGRLPTEVEWEFAARGTDGRTHPWGNKAPEDHLCWRRKESEQSGKGTCPVGSHPKGDSPFGVSDMAGNVREWTSSDFKTGDPRKVERGGAWDNDDAFSVGTVYREKNSAHIRYYNIGIRCAYDKAGT